MIRLFFWYTFWIGAIKYLTKMNIDRLLKCSKTQFEKVLKDWISTNNYQVNYSYTDTVVYLFGDDSTLDQIQNDCKNLPLA